MLRKPFLDETELLDACALKLNALTSRGDPVQGIVGECRRALDCADNLRREDDAQIAACARRQREAAGTVCRRTRARYLKEIRSYNQAGSNGSQRLVANILDGERLWS